MQLKILYFVIEGVEKNFRWFEANLKLENEGVNVSNLSWEIFLWEATSEEHMLYLWI